MIPSQRLPASLTSLETALAALLDRLEPIAAIELPLAEALGCVAAGMPPLKAFPPRDIAVADGWALRARDLVGASSYSPLPLAVSPVWVEAGDAMPDGCDCVIDADSVDRSGPMVQVLAEAIPGQGVRRAGGDIGEGAVIVSGRPVRALDLLIARAAGLKTLSVRRPRLRIVNIPAASGQAVTAALIAENARAAGAEVAVSEAKGRDAASIAGALDAGSCDLLITIGGSGVGRTDAAIIALAQRGEVVAHGIALQPGRTAAIGTNRKNARHRAAGRAGSGAGGVVDAGAPGAGSDVGAATATAGHVAAGAQDRLQRRHRRNRAAGENRGRLDAAGHRRSLASRPSPAPMPGWRCRAVPRALLRERRSMPICSRTDMGSDMTKSSLPKSRDGVDQDQFLTILSREDALARFEAALFPRAVPDEQRTLADALGCALAADIVAPIDVPPFDRSNVDGFAVRSADLASAGEASPVRVLLNDEVIACGTAPTRPVLSGTATSIATGGPVPRGADAIVMVEHTQPAGSRAIEIRRAASPGQFVSYAGSDIARGEALLRAGALIGSREIGMLAACGIAQVPVVRRPRVAVISTGDELVQPGMPLRPAAIYDTNGAIVTAAINENGGEAKFLGAIPDDEAQLEAAMRKALQTGDMLVLSGGTSKGAGDVSHRIIARLGKPGIIAHGVALKPGKPLCLAVCDGKPVVILPGFPTSAMFTFHDMIVPVLRRMAGLPPRSDARVTAKVPVRIASELGRTEFVMVSLVEGDRGLIAYPTGKGSGAITSFAQADGFLKIDALADQMPAGTEAEVTLFTPHVRVPDLVIVGSHCTGLDLVTASLARAGLLVRSIAVGSLGGLAAAKRGECDFAPIHLFDEKTESYNTPFLADGLELVPGWRRMQGIVFRAGDTRFEGLDAQAAVRAALADPACIMVNRNQGAGTRILIDQLLGDVRPDGYWNQPKSHNAVAAAVAQHRADWGMTIAPVAHAAGLGFIPLAEEHYDFALVTARKQRPAVQALLQALASDEGRSALAQAGFRPA